MITEEYNTNKLRRELYLNGTRVRKKRDCWVCSGPDGCDRLDPDRRPGTIRAAERGAVGRSPW